MNIQVRDGLAYVTVTLLYGGQQLHLTNVLLDTGSAGTLFPADQVLAVGLQYEAGDPVQRIRRYRWRRVRLRQAYRSPVSG